MEIVKNVHKTITSPQSWQYTRVLFQLKVFMFVTRLKGLWEVDSKLKAFVTSELGRYEWSVSHPRRLSPLLVIGGWLEHRTFLAKWSMRTIPIPISGVEYFTQP